MRRQILPPDTGPENCSAITDGQNLSTSCNGIRKFPGLPIRDKKSRPPASGNRPELQNGYRAE